MKNKSAIDVQNAFRCANFLVQEQPVFEKPVVFKNNKTSKQFILGILDWSKIIGEGFSKSNPKKLQKYLNLYSNKNYNFVEEYAQNKYGSKSYAKNLISCLKEYIRIVSLVWSQGEGRLFGKFDESYYQDSCKQLKNF